MTPRILTELVKCMDAKRQQSAKEVYKGFSQLTFWGSALTTDQRRFSVSAISPKNYNLPTSSTNPAISFVRSLLQSIGNPCPFPSTIHRLTPFSSPPSSFTNKSQCGTVIIRSAVPWITKILFLPTWSPKDFSCAALL